MTGDAPSLSYEGGQEPSLSGEHLLKRLGAALPYRALAADKLAERCRASEAFRARMVPKLVELLEHPAAHMRGGAAWVLGQIPADGERAVLDGLRRLCADEADSAPGLPTRSIIADIARDALARITPKED